jgi:Ca-activated chloride channel family protein
MNDELDKMKQAFRDSEPTPRAEAKKAALAAAMDVFDAEFEEETSDAHQGSTDEDRPMNRSSGWFAAQFRRFSVNLTFPKLNTWASAGASLVLVTVAVATMTYVITPQEPEQFGMFDADASRNQPPADMNEMAQNKSRYDDKAVILEKRRSLEFEKAPIGTTDYASEEIDNFSSDLQAMEAPIAQSIISPPPGPSYYLTEGVSVQARKHASIANPSTLHDMRQPYYQDVGRDIFEEIEPNQLKITTSEPVSTFSIDVDTASYAFVRASLHGGVLPQMDAVRVEELINYFPYDYKGPDDREAPFKASVSVVPTPWNDGTRLMHVGIRGYDITVDEKPHSNLVFLIDSSGSMNAPNKLPLLVNSFKLVLNSLEPDDTVAIVVYAGSAGTVLEPTKVSEKAKIIASLDRLQAGGSTAGAAGIRQAYALAEQEYVEDGINRVILATDGDFNVGITNQEELKSYIERKRDTGVSLSVLGFGTGNYNDALMQTLAQNGNGNAAYIDTLAEAQKVLVAQASGTLFTIAKDVKIQVEFNPKTVAEYRLIGYETRLLNREDFNNDKIDAGEIGAGHTVTAIYEITPVGSGAVLNDPLRYQSDNEGVEDGSEYAFLKIRYKQPDSDTSTLITTPVTTDMEFANIQDAPTDTRFAVSVAGFGQLLRGGRYTGDLSYLDVINLAKRAKGEDDNGYRAEFISLVRLARSLSN